MGIIAWNRLGLVTGMIVLAAAPQRATRQPANPQWALTDHLPRARRARS